MEFSNVLGRAKQLSGSATDTVIKMMDEFNAAMPTLRGLGFSLQDLQMSMGLLPEVSARLIATAADIDSKVLDEAIKKRSEQTLLVVLLKALQTAYNLREPLGDLGLSRVAVDVTLGLPPKVGIGFVRPAAVAAPAVAAAA